MNEGRVHTHARRYWLACWLAVGLANSLAAEIIYDNTQSAQGTYRPTINECGDEVIFGGSARKITGIQVEYFGEFTSTGTETAIVRFYANDGDTPGRYTSPPGTKLFESSPLSIAQGYNLLTLTNLAVEVPDHFTWTVQFLGITGYYPNRAGLVFYDPPTVGSSFDDFWEREAQQGWTTLKYSGGWPVANFAARIFAAPDPNPSVLSVAALPGDRTQVNISGPTYHTAVVEGSSGRDDWSPLSTVTLRGYETNIVFSKALHPGLRTYRVSLLPETCLALENCNYLTNGTYEIGLSGTPGRFFRVERSSDFVNWSIVMTNYFTSLWSSVEESIPGSTPRAFYRATYLPDIPAAMVRVAPVGKNLALVTVGGPPGRGCIVQASPDLKQWENIWTSSFSFTGGLINFVDPDAPKWPKRYYRAILTGE